MCLSPPPPLPCSSIPPDKNQESMRKRSSMRFLSTSHGSVRHRLLASTVTQQHSHSLARTCLTLKNVIQASTLFSIKFTSSELCSLFTLTVYTWTLASYFTNYENILKFLSVTYIAQESQVWNNSYVRNRNQQQKLQKYYNSLILYQILILNDNLFKI